MSFDHLIFIAMVFIAVFLLATSVIVPAVGSVAPWLVTSGRKPSRRSAATWRNAAPLGAHVHLWKLPA